MPGLSRVATMACRYRSVNGHPCHALADAGTFCPLHVCPAPGCHIPKHSSAKRCPEHSFGGRVVIYPPAPEYDVIEKHPPSPPPPVNENPNVPPGAWNPNMYSTGVEAGAISVSAVPGPTSRRGSGVGLPSLPPRLQHHHRQHHQHRQPSQNDSNIAAWLNIAIPREHAERYLYASR